MNQAQIFKSVFIVLTSMFLLSFVHSSFQASNAFVQFRILSPLDSDSARKIDEKIGSKSGVLESRTDFVTSTYFCLLSPDADFTKEDFEEWFLKLGFEIACYNKGIQNIDAVISPHALKSCTDESEQKN
ncbi:MAG: hypothetical protein JNJ99_09885 [Crocinitomicaceae bacterium]|nr:hypothetical protein [Crocinitomicaceae bacterium]